MRLQDCRFVCADAQRHAKPFGSGSHSADTDTLMTSSAWPLYHIVSDQSRRNLLAARGPGELPELPQGEAVRYFDYEPRREMERPAEIDRLIRQVPVGPERRTA